MFLLWKSNHTINNCHFLKSIAFFVFYEISCYDYVFRIVDIEIIGQICNRLSMNNNNNKICADSLINQLFVAFNFLLDFLLTIFLSINVKMINIRRQNIFLLFTQTMENCKCVTFFFSFLLSLHLQHACILNEYYFSNKFRSHSF